MRIINKIIKAIVVFLINHIFVGTHFYSLKRSLLNSLPNVTVGKKARIVGPITFYCSLSVGEDTFIGRDFNIEGNGKVEIGSNCDFAPHVCLVTGSHQVGDELRRAGKGFSGKISIGSGTWVGARVTVLPNVSIGRGVVVASGAVVTENFHDNCMIAGVPAEKKKDL